MKVKTCTFKNDTPPTGLLSVGWKMGADIKYEKKICGHIYPPQHWSKEDCYRVQLRVKVQEDTIGWKNITLKVKLNSLEEAKQWCKDHWQNILQKYELYYLED